MVPEGSLPNSQQPATCPYPEPDQSSPCPHPTSPKSILILSFHLRLGLPSGLLTSVLKQQFTLFSNETRDFSQKYKPYKNPYDLLDNRPVFPPPCYSKFSVVAKIILNESRYLLDTLQKSDIKF
jgi:hypothetical protein